MSGDPESMPREASPAPTDEVRPPAVEARAKRLLTIAIGNILATVALLWFSPDLVGILLACVTSVVGFVYLLAGLGVRHGAVWALRWLTPAARADPAVHHWFWSDEECPGCASREGLGAAYCAACGHGLNPPPTPWLAGIRFALRRCLRAQPVEPPRTAAFRKREAHESTDKYLLIALALIVGGWIASNQIESLARVGVTVGVIVPAFLMLFWLRRQDRFEPEPMNLILLAFGWGMLCGVFVMPLNTLVIELTGMAQIAGFTEEVAKAAIVLIYATHRTLRKEVNGPTDGLIYAGAAGLGFAAMENFGYVFDIWMGTGDIFAGFALRSVGIVDHMMYAGITGSFMGLMLLRNGRITPRDLLIGIVPGGLIHALNNSMELFGLLFLVAIFIPTVLAAWVFFKLLAESLRDEAAWGHGAGTAPVEAEP